MVQASTNMTFTEKDIGSKVRPTQDTVSTEYHVFKSVDEIFTISKIYGEFCAVVSQTGEEHSGWFHDRFELVDKPKFKPGDKVIINLFDTCDKRRNGDIVTIHSRTEKITDGGRSWDIYAVYGYSVSKDCNIVIDGVVYDVFSENYLELIEPEPFVSCDLGLGNSFAVRSNIDSDSPKLSLSSLDRERTTMMHNVIYTKYDNQILCSLVDGVPMFNASHEDIIKSNYIKYKDMNIIDKIRVNIKGEPMKTLIKNDILTLDERLTTTGKELFADFLYAKHKDEFIEDLAPKLEGLNEDK